VRAAVVQRIAGRTGRSATSRRDERVHLARKPIARTPDIACGAAAASLSSPSQNAFHQASGRPPDQAAPGASDGARSRRRRSPRSRPRATARRPKSRCRRRSCPASPRSRPVLRRRRAGAGPARSPGGRHPNRRASNPPARLPGSLQAARSARIAAVIASAVSPNSA
jgi:hypothetical protein